MYTTDLIREIALTFFPPQAYGLCTSVGQAHPVLSMACLLAGYCEGARGRAGFDGAAIKDAEIDHLQTLVAVRLYTSVTLGIYALSKDPTNEYLKLHAVPGRRALAAVLAIRPVDFVSMVREIQRESLAAPLASRMDIPSVVAIANCCSKVDPAPAARSEVKEPTLTFVTGNKKKLEEVRAILGSGFPFKVTSRSVDLPELQGADPEVVSREKCRLAAQEV